MTIELRRPGRKLRSQPTYETTLPPNLVGRDKTITLRQLLTALIEQEIAAYKIEQKEQILLPFITAGQVNMERSQIGANHLIEAPTMSVSADHAIKAALQAFQNGLFFALINEQQHDELDTPLVLPAHNRITLVRVIALATRQQALLPA